MTTFYVIIVILLLLFYCCCYGTARTLRIRAMTNNYTAHCFSPEIIIIRSCPNCRLCVYSRRLLCALFQAENLWHGTKTVTSSLTTYNNRLCVHVGQAVFNENYNTTECWTLNKHRKKCSSINDNRTGIYTSWPLHDYERARVHNNTECVSEQQLSVPAKADDTTCFRLISVINALYAIVWHVLHTHTQYTE